MPAPDLDTHLDTDLAAERAHLATSRAALQRMRERAEALFATGDQVAGDAYAAETLGRTLARRVAELADDPTTPLFFGRLDFAGTVDTTTANTTTINTTTSPTNPTSPTTPSSESSAASATSATAASATAGAARQREQPAAAAASQQRTQPAEQ